MRFVARAQRAKYVVVPARKVTDLASGTIQAFPGLRARFFNHVFDSEQGQRQNGWTDEERKQVERHLLNHYDFDKGNGYYLEDRQHAATPAVGKMLRCLAFFPGDDGELEQCPGESLAGSEYCSQHIPAEITPAPEAPMGPAPSGRPKLAAAVG